MYQVTGRTSPENRHVHLIIIFTATTAWFGFKCYNGFKN